MCGIAGIVNHQSRADVRSVLEGMNRALTHRGPDGEGYFVDDRVAFGHRRLSIIDLAGGAQPMFNEDGSVAVLLNGEIYNYRKLRSELVSRGHVFKSDADTEVIVHLYEELGSGCVAMLDGMFSLAIYNAKKNRVLLARDRAGKKPLVYFMHGSTLVFASELQALKKYSEFPHELDHESIADFLSLQYIPSPNTVYRGVRKLPPGHQLEYRLDDRQLSIRAYWQLDYSLKNELSFEDAKARLRELVTAAVKKRLMSDVPSGTFLSGGIDSSIVSGLMTQLRGGDPTDGFTIGFAERAYDERTNAKIAAEFINTKTSGRFFHHEKQVDPCDFSLLEKLVMHYGEPYADASMLPTALLSEFARSRIVVAQSGDGADEVFGGYERYIAMRYASEAADWMPGFLRAPLFGTAARLIPAGGERSKFGRLRRLLDCCAAAPEERYFRMLDRCPESVRSRIFSGALREAAKSGGSVFSRRSWELTSPDPQERLSELDFHLYLPNDVLTKVDIASMAYSLEVRSPFLDREVVEFASQLPFEYKLRGKCRKRILREAFADWIAPELAAAPKKGFGVPVSSWLRKEWRRAAEERIFEEGVLFRYNLMEKNSLWNLWEQHFSGRRDWGYLFWGILILSMFLKNEEK